MMTLNRKGFTAVEVVVGVGLVALLTSVMVATQLMVTKDQANLKEKLEDSIDTTLAERIIFQDLNNVDPSYNNLTVKDDEGRPFFDYYPDIPANILTTEAERNVSLKLGGRTEFFIMTQDTTAGAIMTYDPPMAYLIGNPPADFNTSATLEFQSLNRNKSVETYRKNFWVPGKALMLDTPARLRPVESNGSVNMTVAPRSPIFVGAVQGQALAIDPVMKSLLNIKHPETKADINSADAFLRTLPSIGGGQPIVRLRAVKIVKYFIKKYEDTRLQTTPANLYKSVYENGQWSEPFLMADKVAELSFKRDSVLKRMIYFKVKKVEKKKDVQTAGL
ncbi:hypothetical protein QJS83_14000 [Bdellovibrio sp. 22V]|uniref:hypothetical protein n=1 Tax=Bdellovibrio TaxID=958 RepID=UPI002542FAAF|nr:hypothetical protein [Bdellovibrio sp. 22V]WII71578.1 hypothetical protein QJS83_14000 [Bdellovibrio sp. 22V]